MARLLLWREIWDSDGDGGLGIDLAVEGPGSAVSGNAIRGNINFGSARIGRGWFARTVATDARGAVLVGAATSVGVAM